MPRILTALSTMCVLASCAPEQVVDALGSRRAAADVSNSAQGLIERNDLDRFGAAAWIPADYSYFSSTQKLGGLIEEFVDSRAVQSLVRLPMAMMALGKLEESLGTVKDLRAQAPALDDLLALASEALDSEIFVACGPDFETFLEAAYSAYGQLVYHSALRAASGLPPGETVATMVSAIAANRDALRVPTIQLGMRIEDQQRAKAFLDAAGELLDQLPGVVTRTPSPEGLQSWTFKDTDGGSQYLRPQLVEAGVSKPDIDAFVRWVAGLQMTISVGMRDDYLLLSVSDAAKHLREFGTKEPLASLPVFRRARERADTPLLQTYVSPGLRTPTGLDGEAITEFVRAGFPDGERHPIVFKHVAELITELGGPVVSPAPYLTVSYHNAGLETLTIDRRQGAANSEQPLGILKHAPTNATVAYASRGGPSIDAYQRVGHWLRVLLDDYEAIALPEMRKSARESYGMLALMFWPRLAELDAILQDVLLPAIDEHESLLLLDGSFSLDLGPGIGPVDGLTVPKLTLAWRVRDSEQVAEAFDRMRKVAERLLAQTSESSGRVPAELPAPTATKLAAGTLYAYELPLPTWLQPCVLIDGETIVFALTKEHAQAVMSNARARATGGVPMDQPAIRAATISFAGVSELLHKNALHTLRWASQSEQIPAAQATLIWTHLEPALKALAALGSYQSRTWHEGNETLHHSWLRVRDGR